MTGEGLYFWGIYKNKLKDKNNENKILICPICCSKNIVKVTAQEPVFVEVSIPYKCNNCGYQGEPKIINSKENQNKVEK
jgi:C4-type Zn-finger protein